MALSDQIKVPAQVKGAVGGGSSGSGAPAGTGFVRVTDGEYDTPSALSAADMPATLGAIAVSSLSSSGSLSITGSVVATGVISTSSASGIVGNLVRSNSTFPLTLATNTSDGADNQYVVIGNRTTAAPGSSQPGGACIFLYGNENAGTGIVELCPGEAGGVRTRKFNGSVGTQVDGTGLQAYGTGVSVPTGGTWATIATLAATQSSYHVQVDAFGSIILDFDGTTLTALVAAPNLVVAGSAGASQIAFRANGTSLQASNGTGTSRSASCPIRSNR